MEELEMVKRKVGETTMASKAKEMVLHMDEALRR
jgi:hypothetical protein